MNAVDLTAPVWSVPLILKIHYKQTLRVFPDTLFQGVGSWKRLKIAVVGTGGRARVAPEHHPQARTDLSTGWRL